MWPSSAKGENASLLYRGARGSSIVTPITPGAEDTLFDGSECQVPLLALVGLFLLRCRVVVIVVDEEETAVSDTR